MKAVKFVAITLFVLTMLVCLELGLWTFVRVFDDRMVFHNPSRYTSDPQAIRDQNRIFDPELGWTTPYQTPFTERPRQVPGPAYAVTIGDSFVHGDEVSDHEAWAEQLSLLLGKPVVNLGVGGYGMDQALLRYERYLPTIRPQVAIQGFIAENINRNLNVYRRFYFPKTAATFTKPRFELRDNELALVPNPVADTATRERLADPAFLAELGKQDYWYNVLRFPENRFPYTRMLFSASFWQQLSGATAVKPSDLDAAPTMDLWADRNARDLAVAIVDRFVEDSRRAGVRPLVLLLPVQEEVVEFRRSGREPTAMSTLRQECAARGWHCLFPLAAADALFPGDASRYYAPGGHLNASGSAALAKWLATQPQLSAAPAGTVERSSQSGSNATR